MRYAVAGLIACGGWVMAASGDEGMWLPTDPPRRHLRDRYGFDLSAGWVADATAAAVRFNNGGSGGFVSADGLVVTNHHIAADALQKLSAADRDLLRDGFYAPSREAELRCPDLELNVLQSTEDVTARVAAAVPPDPTGGLTPPARQAAARRAVLADIEKESFDATGLRSDVVTLFQGGLYHLYRYKKYTDVRLVFAPEQAIASFGGDVDNFEYPRHALDVAFFRAYEKDRPVRVAHYFRWHPAGPADGDLVAVVGHPGATQRLETLARLKHRRDRSHPYTLARLRALEAAFAQFADRSPENRRRAATDLHRVANARKAFAGQYQGLLDPRVVGQKAAAERDLADRGPDAAPWDAVAAAQGRLAGFEEPYLLVERGDAFASDLFGFARHAVRMAAELPKPNPDRLREYRDSNLDSLKLQLFSPAPVYPDLERAGLTASLTFLAERLGGEHPLVAKALAGRSPADRAADLTAGTELADVGERRRLVDGGRPAVDASGDPLVALARDLDADARALRKRFEDEVEEPERQAYAELARRRFAAYGTAVAPDATFTLRLAFGAVKGYAEDGADVPFRTTLGGAFRRAAAMAGREPFALPDRWAAGQDKLDLDTPLCFVSTADTIGGNSGSPVLNRAGELVGVNFDRNRHGLVRNFVYTDVQARHIAVHAGAVVEVLRKLYAADALADELAGR